ncbi:MAG: LptF/LptG family permease, partial [Gammaproteobacteria bacterium]
AWETLLSPDLLRVLVIDPRYHSIRDLARYIDYLDKNELEAGHYRLAFWANIAAPVNSLVMLLLSVPVVFGSLRSAGTGQRLLVGTLVGLSYYLLTRTIGQLSQVYDISPVVGVFAPLLLFFGAGLFGLWQVTSNR